MSLVSRNEVLKGKIEKAKILLAGSVNMKEITCNGVIHRVVQSKQFPQFFISPSGLIFTQKNNNLTVFEEVDLENGDNDWFRIIAETLFDFVDFQAPHGFEMIDKTGNDFSFENITFTPHPKESENKLVGIKKDKNGLYLAWIFHDKKKINIGTTFNTVEEAICARETFKKNLSNNNFDRKIREANRMNINSHSIQKKSKNSSIQHPIIEKSPNQVIPSTIVNLNLNINDDRIKNANRLLFEPLSPIYHNPNDNNFAMDTSP